MSADLKQRVHARLLASPSLDQLDARDRTPIRARLAELLRDEAPLLPTDRFEATLSELTREVAGLGPLEPLLAEPDVTEVMVNGPGCAFVERGGALEPVAIALDSPAIVRLVERVVAPLGLRLDRASPVVDARLPDGSRLHAVIPPLAVDGPCVTIRRFRTAPVELPAFGLAPGPAAFLEWCVAAGANILVAGGTSSGKTTLLNALSASIPGTERVVTIEETAELRLAQPHVVRLEARPPNAEGAGGVTVRELVRASLRMRPDRIVVGEVRGAEALDMLQALNTGHDGSLSTVHANGVAESIARLETLVLFAESTLPLPAVRAQIDAALDVIVFVARRRDGSRVVERIAEVAGTADGVGVRTLWERDDGALVPRGRPERGARRVEADPPDPAWWADPAWRSAPGRAG